MNTARVVGRFLHEDGSPIESIIAFYPYPLWITKRGKAWATRTVEQELDDGRFDVEITPGVPYYVITPLGKWTIKAQDLPDGVQYLRDMLPSHLT